MKHLFLFLILICVINNVSFAQTAIAKLKFEEAEEAFVNEEYETALTKLDEAEKIFGKVNPPIMYLRIISQYKTLPDNPHLDFKLLQALRKNCKYYLAEYGGIESIQDKYKEVYQISEYLKIYSSNQNFVIARQYFYGTKDIPADIAKAKVYCQKAIAEGDIHAENLMGYIVSGDGKDEKNKEIGMEWHRKAADKGNVFGLYNLASVYNWGNGIVNKDPVKALSLYEQAANKGYPQAMFYLGYKFENGLDVNRDYQKAFDWYQKAADRNHSNAMYRIAVMYNNGSIGTPDKTLFIKWLTKASKANNGIAMQSLAYCYRSGDGVEKSESKYLEWMTKSAEQYNREAMYVLGLHYSIQKDYDKAISWYEKASEYQHYKAIVELGNLYNRSYEKIYNPEKAFFWFTKASEFKEFDQYTMNELGHLYEEGKGVGQDYTKAMELYQKSAEMGFNSSYFDIGDLYYKGLGVEKNYAKALEYYNKSGLDWAKRRIAKLYLEGGPGLPQNVKLGIDYLTRSAVEDEDEMAMYALADIYEKGVYVKANPKKAAEWKEKAYKKMDSMKKK